MVRPTWTRACGCVLALALVGGPPVASTLAQDRERGEERPRRGAVRAPRDEADGRRQPEGKRHGRRCGPDGRMICFGCGPWPVRQLFDLAPPDRGPLQPGEAEELLHFAEEHLPRFYQALEQLRRRNPERFRQQLAEHAPRLRQLRRIRETSPVVADIIEAHAENGFKVRRLLRRLGYTPRDTAEFDNTWQKIRARIAENVRLEISMLNILADELEKRRRERIDQRYEHVIVPDTDLTAEPARLRAAVAGLHAAESETERAEARVTVRNLITNQVVGEIKALRERAACMAGSAATQVDGRMERLRERLERRGHGRGRGRPRDRLKP